MMRDHTIDELDQVVLVNERDEAIGSMEKMAAHRQGALHRAFSIFLFDRSGRTLLQQRAEGKYHSAGLWSNACCSHPRPGEGLASATSRRLFEELGITSDLIERFAFTYQASLGNDLLEHEFDHVFFGGFEGDTHPDPEEVKALRWIAPEQLDAEILAGPERFTPWLLICWEQVREHLLQKPIPQ
jgi:isopentenyl-diphosphate delta-isomerase